MNTDAILPRKESESSKTTSYMYYVGQIKTFPCKCGVKYFPTRRTNWICYKSQGWCRQHQPLHTFMGHMIQHQPVCSARLWGRDARHTQRNQNVGKSHQDRILMRDIMVTLLVPWSLDPRNQKYKNWPEGIFKTQISDSANNHRYSRAAAIMWRHLQSTGKHFRSNQ